MLGCRAVALPGTEQIVGHLPFCRLHPDCPDVTVQLPPPSPYTDLSLQVVK